MHACRSTLEDPTDAATSGNVVWDSGACPTAVKGGSYAVSLGLGCGASLSTDAFAGGASRWLEIQVSGMPMSPRQVLDGQPRAHTAHGAGAIDWSGGTVALGATGKWPASALDVPANLLTTGGDGRIDAAVLPASVPVTTAGRLPASVLPGSVPLVDGAGKVALSTLPTGPNGLDAGSVSGHTPEGAGVGDQRIALRSAAGVLNADRAGGWQVSATPTADRLLPLDAAGMFPSSVLPGTPSTFTSLTLGGVTLDDASMGALLAPVLRSPAPDAIVATLTPLVTWTGPGPFTVEVATYDAGAQTYTPISSSATTATSQVVTASLAFGTTYGWRVKSTAGGATATSDWRRFTPVAPLTVGPGSTDGTKTTLAASVLAGATSLTSAAAVFSDNDWLLVIDSQGAASPGTFELVQVATASGTSLSLKTPLAHSYVASDKVQLQKVLTGSSVTVNGAVTASAWNGTAGGIVALRADGDLTLSAGASISADSLGFSGGAWRNTCSGVGVFTPNGSGDSFRAAGSYTNDFNDGASGGSEDGCAACTTGGTGSSHGTHGSVGLSNTPGSLLCAGGQVGMVYGDATNTDTAFFGSGGGGGAPNSSNGGPGGRGGGIVILIAGGTIDATAGSLSARGGVGNGNEYTGGGGAGGTILLIAPVVKVGTTVDVSGGAPGQKAGAGGAGRVKIFRQAP